MQSLFDNAKALVQSFGSNIQITLHAPHLVTAAQSLAGQSFTVKLEANAATLQGITQFAQNIPKDFTFNFGITDKTLDKLEGFVDKFENLVGRLEVIHNKVGAGLESAGKKVLSTVKALFIIILLGTGSFCVLRLQELWAQEALITGLVTSITSYCAYRLGYLALP